MSGCLILILVIMIVYRSKAKSVPSPATKVENDENIEARPSSPGEQPPSTSGVS